MLISICIILKLISRKLLAAYQRLLTSEDYSKEVPFLEMKFPKFFRKNGNHLFTVLQKQGKWALLLQKMREFSRTTVTEPEISLPQQVFSFYFNIE